MGSVNTIEGAIGPTLMLQLPVEGLQVAAVVDTASNSIISRPMLHKAPLAIPRPRQAYSLVVYLYMGKRENP